MNTEVFESKLKRHRINYSIMDNKIIIGEIKKDYLNSFILGLLPIIFGVGLLIFLFFIEQKSDSFIFPLTSASILLVGYGFFNFQKVKRKSFFNDSIKIFEKGKISIESKEDKIEITPANVQKILYFTRPITKDLYEGAIIIIDKNQIEHKILGINDENETYLKNDIKSFYEFVLNEIGIKVSK